MKKYIYFITLLLLSFMFSKCKNNSEIKLNSTLKNDFISINIDTLKHTPILFSSVFKGFTLIPLETKEECLIGRVDQLNIVNDTIYVLDSNISKCLIVFDNKGRYQKKIGKIGKGPGEYSIPSSFSIDLEKKQIIILDAQQLKLIKYSIQGKFIKEIRLNHEATVPIQIASQDSFVYIDQLTPRYGKAEYLLCAINNDGKIDSKWFSYKSYCKGFNQPINNSRNFFKTSYDIKYTKTLFDTIFSIKNNIIKPYMIIKTNNIMSKEDVNKLNSYNELNDLVHYLIGTCKKFIRVSDYVETEDLIYFEYKMNGYMNRIFYYKNGKNIISTNYLIDDLTFQKYIAKFYAVKNNQFISCIQNTYLNEIEILNKNIKNNKIILSGKNRLDVDDLTIESNPIIILYELKEKYEVTADNDIN